jgi:aryl-alcohol dehydrogenase-like predicted oxidoreductase
VTDGIKQHQQHFGVGAIPWSPLARGALTRPLEKQNETKRAESDGFVH